MHTHNVKGRSRKCHQSCGGGCMVYFDHKRNTHSSLISGILTQACVVVLHTMECRNRDGYIYTGLLYRSIHICYTCTCTYVYTWRWVS